MTTEKRPDITIVNCETNETIVREMTVEEFNAYKKQQETMILEEAARE
jgi:hypothetical protein